MKTTITRRDFLRGVAGTSAALFAAPRILRSASPSSQVRYAFVATGGRGGAHLGLANNKDGICVAYCDVDKGRWGNIAKKWPNAPGYTDYRKMLEKHAKEIDAVTVATPDHNHAPASIMAMKMGKHVYCEKPLTWSVQEARQMAELCAEKKVATQMGNQGHANEGNRLVVEYVQGGLLGDIQEVHTWTNRPIWPQGITERPPSQPVPANLDWEAWLGPAPMRPYGEFKNRHPKTGNVVSEAEAAKITPWNPYHSFKWRGWFDFGCGAIGDMGCHTWDCVNWAIDADYPTSVTLLKIVGDGRPETFPKQAHFKWEFPAKASRPPFTAHWYSGGLRPQEPEEMQGRKFGGSGNLFVGSKAKLYVAGDYGNSPRLIPESLHKEVGKPPQKLERSPGHHQEWVMAIKGEKPWNYPGSSFLYAGPMTELMLLGCIAIKIGEVGYTFECDPLARKILTKRAADLAGRENRKGWRV